MLVILLLFICTTVKTFLLQPVYNNETYAKSENHGAIFLILKFDNRLLHTCVYIIA